ncbi:hypothetical protein DICPUDRAFT_95912 [Dictyostelium purpureum]|uniref:EF-hand domain-containing protein n=1 Tax=Dictyostelium purpureum TaxID=5786 RepID=F1A2I4_DICPU|nr:uncharacterized protein DICPUDRAFT_95912 [Dictyostelium purpureum]EGC29594.1 hypothetical protein DICPUDRAFT_95912 [Dictyostelium purpureum]|eukprot:XP_003293878.1 hypothetical protein DICPUDRAFT_95912 [Dictyostelium purpureum]
MGQNSSKLSKSDIDFIAQSTNFSKNEVETLYQDFKKNDKDGNGSFDRKEFVTFFKSKLTNYPEDQLYKLFDAFDTDKSGSIDFKELSTALSVISKGSAEEKLAVLFDIYDEDKSNTLEAKEVTKMINLMVSIGVSIGRPESDVKIFIVKLIEKIDADKSQSISREEWIKEGSKSPSLLTLLGI